MSPQLYHHVDMITLLLTEVFIQPKYFWVFFAQQEHIADDSEMEQE